MNFFSDRELNVLLSYFYCIKIDQLDQKIWTISFDLIDS